MAGSKFLEKGGLSGGLLPPLDFEIRVSRPLSKSSKDVMRN